MIKSYYLLLKPGIIFGNLITMSAAFFLGGKGRFDISLWAASILGLFCVIASACVFNNCIDRKADAKMKRTKNRPLVKGLVSVQGALLFASILGVFGFGILGHYTNWIAFSFALIGWVVYVVFYSLGKYKTWYAVWIGSMAGATPPVVGYCAASGSFDPGAVLLFLALVFWQMAHFFSIAIYRLDEYENAGIPLFPLVQGIYATKIHMLAYIGAFLVCLWALHGLGYVGWVFTIGMAALGLAWFGLGIQGLSSSQDQVWARRMFRVSLFVVMGLSVMMAYSAGF